uniref:Rev protein n=1 Tax=Ovine lentivirus TaxID=11663 RepID=Q7ZSJ5_9RETR|nr:rev protein [Ovine lentivirus]
MASGRKPDRMTWKEMEPPLRETWGKVVNELAERQRQEDMRGLITGIQTSERDQIYTGNHSDRRTSGPRGKPKRRHGWFKWLRKLKAREKTIPAEFYPDLEGNIAGLEELCLGKGLEENSIYEPTPDNSGPAMDGRQWLDWREQPQK